MLLLYNSLLHLTLIILSPIIVPFTLCSKKYRANLRQRLGFVGQKVRSALSSLRKRPLLIHAVSVGEVGVALPIVRRLARLDIPVVLSTITTSGQAYAEEQVGQDAITVYMPFDLPLLMRRFLRLIGPRGVIVLETELWPNLISAAHKARIPLALVNGRISDNSFSRYRLTRRLWKRILPKCSTILAQTEQDEARLIQIGAPENLVNVAGTVKLDIASRKVSDAERRRTAEGFGLDPARTVFVAGSTHPGEDEIVLDVFLSLRERRPDLAMILAPRHVERGEEIAAIAAQRGVSHVRRSRQGAESAKFDVLVLDTIGELMPAYQIAAVAFVGKSLAPDVTGGQNPIEPAACGVPTLFGPNMQNFRFAADMLVSSGAALRVSDEQELLRAASDILSSPKTRERMGKAALDVLAANRGAVDRIMAHLERGGFFDGRGAACRTLSHFGRGKHGPYSRLKAALVAQLDPGLGPATGAADRIVGAALAPPLTGENGHDKRFPYDRRQGRIVDLCAAILLASLEPVAVAYGAAVGLRTALYKKGRLKSYRPPCAAVCVGNITSGGAGKTPAVILICQLLQQMGKRVAVLSRGYGRIKRSVQVLAPDALDCLEPRETLKRFGDEVLTIAAHLSATPVVVAADRAAAAKVACERFAPDVLVMDDGFGHLRLRRDLDILVFDAKHPFANRRLLPCGMLREPLWAIERAGAAIISRTDRCEPDELEASEQAIRRYNPGMDILRSVHRPTGLMRISDSEAFDLEYLKGKTVLAFCGIARPNSFFSTLSTLGASVTGVPFPDHHAYREGEIASLMSRQRTGGFDLLVTTEKDAPRVAGLCAEEAVHLLVLRVEMALTGQDDVAKLREILADVMRQVP
ncbi:MAG: tetraacyldisaccharide 4'-kinase [Candidatus Coatesbacteria bacterium]|nr:tetraacyldisaccharide 4'-kinase [Candidatus Coatesbacteria bacterium]